MKKTLKILLLVIAVVVAIAAVIVIASQPKEGIPAPKAEIIDVRVAQAQTYAAVKEPVLNSNDKIFGSAEAPVKIFVYENYEDLYSAILADTLERVRGEEGERVALIVRPYAAGNSLSAQQAALAVDCAGEEGKWPEMRALLFAQVEKDEFSAAKLLDYARQIEIDEDNFVICLTKKEKSEKIEQSEAEAETYAVQGTPTMFIGGEMILGARPYDDFVDSNGDKIEGLKTVVAKKVREIE